MTCPACGQALPGAFAFCPFCGAQVGGPPPGPARVERKVVTVLFADLAGFTARAERLDPEDVAALLAPFQARLRSELERFGGTVEKFIGDGVMAIFGAPVAHEDDPERAVRAALAIRDWTSEQDGLHLRVAVNTGEVLVSLDARADVGESVVTGDVVNTAARLQAGAPVDGILVGEQTFRATEAAIEYRPAEHVVGKGKSEPIAAWEAVQARSRFGADVTRSFAAPLVGRVRELELLVSTLGRVRDERSPQLVTIVGVPGIGKSRLVRELFGVVEQAADPTGWRQGRALPYGDGVTFWALAEIVKAQAGILESDDAAASAEKLACAVREVGRDDSESHWLERHLGALVGVAEGSSARLEERFAAWRRFLEALAERRPLVLVFEDLHWADDVLLDFVDELVTRASGVPLYVVGTARPELLTRRPGWGGGKANALAISLSPLSDDDTARLVRSLLSQVVLEAELHAAVLAHAGGNPLYAEQFTRVLAERGALEELPETVQGIIAARLDGLPDAEKRLLQAASVVGKVFWSGAVEAVDGLARWEVEELLHALERKEFVQRTRASAVGGESEWSFRHVLIRDVAYGQLPRAARSLAHRRVAGWLESLGRPEERAELLAHHHLQALRLAEAAGLEADAQLVGRARKALAEAGERALRLPAIAAAAELFEAALELCPVNGPERPRLKLGLGTARLSAGKAGLDLVTGAYDLFRAAGDAEGAAEAATAAARFAWQEGDRVATDRHITLALDAVKDVPTSPARAAALVSMSGFHMLAGEFDEAIRVGNEALAVMGGGADEQRGRLHVTMGCSRCCLGDAGGFLEIEEGIAISRGVGAINSVVVGYGNLGSELFFFGRIADARRAWEEELELSVRYGLPQRQRSARVEEAAVAFLDGRWDEAYAAAGGLIREIEVSGRRDYSEPGLLVLRAAIRLARGDEAGADADTRAAAELARGSDAQAQAQAYSVRAAVAHELGERREADELASALAAIGPVLLPALCSPFPTLADVAWVFRDLGREDEFVAVLDATPIDSAWVEIGRAIVSGDPARAAEISDRIGHRACAAHAHRRAAAQLVAEGRLADAAAQLEPALEFYRDAGATRTVGECDALLVRTAC